MKRTTDIELNGISPSILQRLSSTPCDPQINTLYKIITNTVKPLYIYIYIYIYIYSTCIDIKISGVQKGEDK